MSLYQNAVREGRREEGGGAVGLNNWLNSDVQHGIEEPIIGYLERGHGRFAPHPHVPRQVSTRRCRVQSNGSGRANRRPIAAIPLRSGPTDWRHETASSNPSPTRVGGISDRIGREILIEQRARTRRRKLVGFLLATWISLERDERKLRASADWSGLNVRSSIGDQNLRHWLMTRRPRQSLVSSLLTAIQGK